MNDRAQQLLSEFHRAHLGTAHGLAKVLVFLADNHGDPESWDAVPASVLYELAAELTAELPAPYGNGEPPKGKPLRALEAAQAGIILNELQAARELADRVQHHWDGMECVDHLQVIAAELKGDAER